MANTMRFKKLRRVYRTMSMKQMEFIIQRQKSRGWVPVSEVVELTEASTFTRGWEPYRYKVVMEFPMNISRSFSAI